MKTNFTFNSLKAITIALLIFLSSHQLAAQSSAIGGEYFIDFTSEAEYLESWVGVGFEVNDGILTGPGIIGTRYNDSLYTNCQVETSTNKNVRIIFRCGENVWLDDLHYVELQFEGAICLRDRGGNIAVVGIEPLMVGEFAHLKVKAYGSTAEIYLNDADTAAITYDSLTVTNEGYVGLILINWESDIDWFKVTWLDSLGNPAGGETAVLNNITYNQNWKLYPNPVVDILNLQNNDLKTSLSDNTIIQVINLNGSIVFEKMLGNEKVSRIDVSSLNKGIYILKILERDNIYINKFMKL